MSYNNPYAQMYPYGMTPQNQAAFMQAQSQQFYQPAPAALQPQSSSPPIGLNGKVVDSADVVKATEVPIGGYGVFPRADLNEIYVKSWNNNGTTSVTTYQPVAAAETATESADHHIALILQKITTLEGKLDFLLNLPTEQNQTEKMTQNFEEEKVVKKEGIINAF